MSNFSVYEPRNASCLGLCLWHQVGLPLRTTSFQSLCFFLSWQSSFPQHGFAAIMLIWSRPVTSVVLVLPTFHAPVRIYTGSEQASGASGLFLPPVCRTVCLVPSSCSEKEQEATFLPGELGKASWGKEIFKERERLAEKSQ